MSCIAVKKPAGGQAGAEAGALAEGQVAPGRKAPSRAALLAGFRRMPPSDKALLLMAFAALVIAAPLLRLVPFSRLAPLFGRPIGPVAWMPLLDARQSRRAQAIRRAVRRAARLSPFRRDCLPQALAGAALCRFFAVPAAVHLGVRKSGSTLEAHAWVCSGGVAVAGGQSFAAFTVVSCFALGVKER